jgi:hypothetical protein
LIKWSFYQHYQASNVLFDWNFFPDQNLLYDVAWIRQESDHRMMMLGFSKDYPLDNLFYIWQKLKMIRYQCRTNRTTSSSFAKQYEVCYWLTQIPTESLVSKRKYNKAKNYSSDKKSEHKTMVVLQETRSFFIYIIHLY